MTLFAELKRRNVFRVAIAYLVTAWLLIQLTDVLVPMLTLPEWVSRLVLLLLVILFVPVLIAAWALELTPDGLKLEKDVDREASIAPTTGKRINGLIIGALALAVVLLLFDKLVMRDEIADVAAVGETENTGSMLTADKSVAVLPFADLSQNQDQEWFADGLAEEILNALARAPDLLIPSRTSTFSYKGTDKDLRTIATELGVAHVLEGSVRRAGDRIRVTAQLIRASDGFHLWSQNYDRDAVDIIDIQEDLAVQIARALETTMDPESLANMARVGTRSVPAYEAYIHGSGLRAQSFLENRNDKIQRAFEFFEVARSIDPEFSAAHASVADYWEQQLTPVRFQTNAFGDLNPVDFMQSFIDSINLAIATSKDEADTLSYRAQRAFIEMRLRESLRLSTEYLALRPNDFEAWRSHLDTAALVWDEPAIKRALAFLRDAGLDNPEAASYFVDSAYKYGDVKDAVAFGLQAIDRWPLQNIMYQTHRALLFDGRVEDAANLITQYEQRYPLHPLLIARQACAEGRADDVRALFKETYVGTPLAISINPRWLIWKMLADEEAALATLRESDFPEVPVVLGSWLNYPHFDPSPFPSLMAIIERENIDRPPPTELPYACTVAARASRI